MDEKDMAWLGWALLAAESGATPEEAARFANVVTDALDSSGSCEDRQ